MTARLLHVPDDWLIPWQWHRPHPWTDAVTGKETSYLSGFSTKAAAIEYGRRHGWDLPSDTE